MKRTVLSALVFLAATASFAGEPARYLVATRHSARGTQLRFEGRDGDITFRETETFECVNGFAATMTPEEAAELRTAPGVRFVELDHEVHALRMSGARAADASLRSVNGQTIPYGIDLVRAREAWPVSRGRNVNVVVLDTGLDLRHSELQPAYAGGYNTYAASGEPIDDNGHGTHVSGTIAAADNDSGVAGVAPAARLWSVKVLKASGSGTNGKIISGIDWVLSKKRQLGGNWIMSLSLGGADSDVLLEEAFARAIDAGVLVVAASGNESTATAIAPVGYPAAYPGVIAVGAVDSAKAIADFSNQGPDLALVAPGVDVLSTLPLGTGSISFLSVGGALVDAQGITGSKKGSVTASFVNCGLGRAGDFPSSVAGKIALIQRGSLTFNEKTKNAVAAGASGVVIYNNVAGATNWTLGDQASSWPVTVALSQTDGEALLKTPDTTITITYKEDDFGSLSGTSMATPHVAGVAALVWAAVPSATAADVKRAMTNGATDLGAAGFDTVYGFGLVNAVDSIKWLAPQLFAAPAAPATTPTGRRALKRG